VVAWADEKHGWIISARRVKECWDYFRQIEHLGLFPADEIGPDHSDE
jgi:hypothetical protein